MTNTKTVKATSEAAKVNSIGEANYMPGAKATFEVEQKSLYKTTAAIQSAIEAALVAGNSVQHEQQRIVCSVLLHVATHKNIHVVRNFLNTLPESNRKVSMSAFVERFGTVSFDDKGVAHYDKDKKLNLAGALALAWWKATKEEGYVPFSFAKEVAKLLTKAEKRLVKARPEEGDVISPEEVASLRNLYNSLPEVQAMSQEEQALAA